MGIYTNWFTVSRSSNSLNEPDPTAIQSTPKGLKTYTYPGAQTSGGSDGGKGTRGTTRTKQQTNRRGPGTNRGNNQPTPIKCHSVRTAASLVWQVKFLSLPTSGTLELWPEEESRSGRDTKPVQISSCSIPDALISANGLSVNILLNESTPKSFALTLSRNVGVIDMRPVIKEAGK